jgi:transcriptional regulator with XRE-family HTH domain
MSKFSEKLKLLVEESGMKIYQLAKNSELDRTTIHRAITGERLPGLKFLEKLSEYLKLSPSEREEIFELYSISKIGEEVYEGRKYIKELIQRIATIHAPIENTSTVQKNVSYSKDFNFDNAVFTGQYIVNNMIKDVLESEILNTSSPEISISVPFSYTFLFDLLHQFYLNRNGKIIIKNIIRLIKNPRAYQNSKYNLEILSNVMPFAFSAGNGYQPYYYYDNFDSSNDIALLMPYYIITSKYLFTISPDFKTAILYDNESIVSIYKEKFKIALAQAVLLIDQHFSCEDLISAYMETCKGSDEISHVIEPQPCFAWYYTNDLINTHLREGIENRETCLELLYNFYRRCQSYINRPMSIFSVEGLSYFVSTGIISDFPIQYALPFTKEERIMLLTKLRNDIINDVYKVYATNSLKFLIPLSAIQLYNTKGLEFFVINNNGIMSSSFIEEKSICEAFYDFCENLPDSGLVYNKEETIKIIDDFIEYLSVN